MKVWFFFMVVTVVFQVVLKILILVLVVRSADIFLADGKLPLPFQSLPNLPPNFLIGGNVDCVFGDLALPFVDIEAQTC